MVPETLQGYPLQNLCLRLSLAWWSEDAQIYVDGNFKQAGDLFDYFTRICLSSRIAPGQTFTLALRLVSPSHDDGALVRSHLIYEVPPASDLPSPEPSFIADELEVLQIYVQALAPEKLADLEAALGQLDWSILKAHENQELETKDQEIRDLAIRATIAPESLPPSPSPLPLSRIQSLFHQSLAILRQHLLPLSAWIKHHHIHCLGHAHLDLAWLWPVAETWRAAERTFESVLALQNDFPELTYTHSSPALFAWVEQHRPDLFTTIQEKVKAGSWSIDAGLWVEPELNIVSGEAIARQILYGQRYCQEKFGQISPIAWLPDTFGFCAQLPQLLKLGGIKVFATQKLRWNDTTEFPHDLFTWQAPDGSQVLGWTLPPIGTDFDPVAIAQYATQWTTKTQIPHALWLPGIGDHGGGPTRDMLAKAQRWAQSPFFPQVSFTHATDFVTTITHALSGIPDRPVHPDPDNSLKSDTPTSPPPPPPHLVHRTLPGTPSWLLHHPR
jgi:alpha-mannosidase